jgi:CelD/BcsL family acetyltransferase involved in cellulose biosynthesis
MQRTLDIEALTDLPKIIDIIPEWESLVARYPAQGFFRRPAWYLSWLENFFSAATPLVILVRDGGAVVGIAPLCIVQHGIRRTVKFGGSDVVCGDYLDFISLPEYRAQASEHIFRYLTEVAQKWDDLKFDGVSTESTLLAELAKWTSHRKFMLRANANSTICPYINLPMSFDAYLASLERKRKKHFVRIMRRSQ